MKPHALDHVALWVSDRQALAAFLCDHVGMHEIQRADDFTLVGSDARRGKLTLFDAEGPREPGVLARVALRVTDLGRAVAKLPSEVELRRRDGDQAVFDAPDGLQLALVSSARGVEYDIDHVLLRTPEPERTLEGLRRLGFAREGASLAVGDKRVEVERGAPAIGDRPLLNHLALLVESGPEKLDEARREGLEVLDVRDTENTFALFVLGPDGIQVEYVEHKPTFSLT
jgi:catechol 2,3-dioxygenase-like lactoylglutathione lyase family enzyme